MFKVGPPGSQWPLCLDCKAKHDQIMARQADENARAINYFTDIIEATTGVPGLPRYSIPRRAPLAAAPITFNNISVSNSNIGVLNTGTLKVVDSAISVLGSQPGGADLGKVIGKLAEAIATSTDLQDQARRDAMDILGVIASEATIPSKARKPGVIRPLLGSLATLIQTSASLVELWTAYGPTLRAWFGL